MFNNTTASNNFAQFRNPTTSTSNIEVTFTLPSPIYGVTKIETLTYYTNEASINGGALFTLAQTGSTAFNTLYNSTTPINLTSIKMKRTSGVQNQTGSMFWNYIKVNGILLVNNVNPSLDYRLSARAALFSNIIYLQPIEEFTSGELGSNQTINHNTSTMLSLQLKSGLDQWGNGDYTISGMLTLSSDSDIIYKAELSIKVQIF